MTVNDNQPGTNPAPSGLPVMLAALLAEGYSAAFALDPAGRADCFVDLTGPLGSQATGLGDSPGAALASVWPLGSNLADVQDDDVIYDPAVAALARKVAALREYVSGVLASGGELVGPQYALERVAEHLTTIGALLVTDPAAVEDGPGDELEAYCRTCGHWIGHFLGLDGWQHFQGEPAAGGRRTLHDADHETVPAWCVPPGRALSPADVAVIREALADTAGRDNGYTALLGRMTGEAAQQ